MITKLNLGSFPIGGNKNKKVLSVKRVDTFRIALAEEQNLLIKEKHSQGHQLSILFSSSVIETFFFLILEKLH